FDDGGERLGRRGPGRRRLRQVERARAEERLGGAAGVAFFVANEAQVVLRVAVLRVLLDRVLDERRRLLDLTRLVIRAADQERVARALERTIGNQRHRPLRLLHVALA